MTVKIKRLNCAFKNRRFEGCIRLRGSSVAVAAVARVADASDLLNAHGAPGNRNSKFGLTMRRNHNNIRDNQICT